MRLNTDTAQYALVSRADWTLSLLVSDWSWGFGGVGGGAWGGAAAAAPVHCG